MVPVSIYVMRGLHRLTPRFGTAVLPASLPLGGATRLRLYKEREAAMCCSLPSSGSCKPPSKVARIFFPNHGNNGGPQSPGLAVRSLWLSSVVDALVRAALWSPLVWQRDYCVESPEQSNSRKAQRVRGGAGCVEQWPRNKG